jgi:hypothetical protein
MICIQEAGFFRMWIINPENKTILVYILKDGIFIGQHPLIEDDKISIIS